MRTDALFHRLFSLEPNLLLTLLNRPTTTTYGFQSVTVKDVRKEIDGYFEPVDGAGPLLFLEVQGYNDDKVVWRLLREVAMTMEHRDGQAAVVAVILCLDRAKLPEGSPIPWQPPHELVLVELETCLRALPPLAGASNVLRPLVAEELSEVARDLPTWKAGILDSNYPEPKKKELLQLLEFAIFQRFPKLTIEETRQMIQLTPLEEVVAVKQLMAMSETKGIQLGEAQGEARGKAMGRQRGLLEGQLQLARRLRQLQPYDQETLDSLTSEQLQAEAEELMAAAGLK
jgi:predicted transposase YdaD